MFPRLIHVVARVRASFLLLPEYCCIVWMYHILFLHPEVHGHLGGFYLVATMNDTAVNIWVQVFL